MDSEDRSKPHPEFVLVTSDEVDEHGPYVEVFAALRSTFRSLGEVPTSPEPTVVAATWEFVDRIREEARADG